MRCDLVCAITNFQTNRAEPFALSPQGVGDWRHDALDVLGGCSCGGVKVNGREVRVGIGRAHQ